MGIIEFLFFFLSSRLLFAFGLACCFLLGTAHAFGLGLNKTTEFDCCCCCHWHGNWSLERSGDHVGQLPGLFRPRSKYALAFGVQIGKLSHTPARPLHSIAIYLVFLFFVFLRGTAVLFCNNYWFIVLFAVPFETGRKIKAPPKTIITCMRKLGTVLIPRFPGLGWGLGGLEIISKRG